MNKLLTASVFALAVTLSSGAMASGFQGPQARGGFQGPGLDTSTVAQALEMRDDTAVVLSGQIEKSLGHEKYMFKDATGTVIVEIDDDDWRGLNVTPKDTVIISGEVDKEMLRDTEIDVDSIELKK